MTLATPFVVICLLTITMLTVDAARHIRALATANSDSAQWSLAQLEVEFSALLIHLSIPRDEADPQALRRAFDIFYSRFQTVSRGAGYSEIVQTGDAHDVIARIDGFLSNAIPLIDGPDAALLSARPDLRFRAESIAPDVRSVSLQAMGAFSRQSDAQRSQVMNALLRLAALTAALVLTLALGVASLWRAVHVAHQETRQRNRASHRFKAVVATALDGIVVTDRNGRILELNAAATGIFGHDRASALGQSARDLLFQDDLPFETIINAGRIRTCARHADGKAVPIELSVTFSERDDHALHVLYLRDISQTLAAESELVAARDQAVAGERAKARFLAVMSHEMRTPLNGLIGVLELFDDTDLDAEQSEYMRVLKRSGDTLLARVNDVLDISRLEAGSFAFARDPLNPAEIVTDVADSLRPSALARNTDLDTDLPDTASPILGDAIRLRQVLDNLVGNAVKFTENGQITIEMQQDGDTLIIAIEDSGIGIDADRINHIFEDFVTLDSSFMRRAEGTGLGLGIARRLVEGMGGTIAVDSLPGVGSTFTLTLPAPRATQASLQVEPHLPEAPEQAVLLVEDNPVNRLVASAMLRKLGHCVTEAHDGAQGLLRAEESGFDLILMDISMPRMDGLETTRRIRAGTGPNRDTRIVALTAHALPEDLNRFRKAGMNDTLTKPLTRRALSLTLATGAPPPAGSRITADDRHDPFPDTLFDTDILDAAREALGDTAFENLRSQFLSETETSLTRLARDISGNRIGPMAYAAEMHRLAGSAAVFGATAVHLALRKQEDRARKDGLVSGGDHADVLALWHRFRKAFEKSVRPKVGEAGP